MMAKGITLWLMEKKLKVFVSKLGLIGKLTREKTLEKRMESAASKTLKVLQKVLF